MKKKAPDRYFLPEFLRKMLAAVYLLFIVSLSYAAADNDTKLITFAVKSENLNDVLIKFKDQTGVDILFNKQLIGNRKCNDFEVVNQPVEVILSKILEGTGFVFSKVDGVYVIKKSTEKIVQPVEPLAISGVVTDTDGAPLPGVTVLVKGTSLGSATDTEGKFKLSLPSQENVVLVFSFVGMQTKEVPYKGESEIKVTLQTDVTEMEQVVVTGIFTRKTESYTGAATTIKKEELQKMGNQNVLQSLKSLDPAFHIIENNDFGSDPNKAPQIQLRGQQSMPDIKGTYNGNPNQPLFILDGFETDITTVYDLDMNRVETIVLLKDAAAKAIYGAKAANGVVVIETRQPKAGKMRISYKGDLSLTIPDLTGYNLCDAREKYEVDKAHGRYSDPWFWEQYLNQIKSEIERGVDTDWLAQPLHTGIGHRHSLYLDGGDEHLRYGVDLLYNEIKGVMKGSDRQTFTGGITLAYRYKDLLFRNQLSTTLNRANDSPYGSFDEYAKLNPYWTATDENGNVKRFFDEDYSYWGGNNPANPLYNATLNTKETSDYTNITNNFSIEWKPVQEFTLRGTFGIYTQTNNSDKYLPPEHTAFADYADDDYFRRGTYDYTTSRSSRYNFSLTANYSKVFAEKHMIYAGLNMDLEDQKSQRYSFSVEGFPSGALDFLAVAMQYKENGKPGGSESKSRRVGFVGNASYSFEDRYFVDASFRTDGSSLYGADKRFAPFWSAGIGWNIHRENFMSNVDWINRLKIRASVGETGSNNFSAYEAMVTYTYSLSDRYYNWMGANLKALANPDLEWQKTMKYNTGVEVNLLNNRLNMICDLYLERTNGLMSSLELPPSNGFTSYKANIGKLENKGFELKVTGYLLRDTERELIWSVTGSLVRNKDKIIKLSEAMKEANATLLATGGATPNKVWQEGDSQNAIYAVPSLGIDPSNGRELFLKKSGEVTYTWDARDRVFCGVDQPDYRGNINTMFMWRDLSVNLSFGYEWGGQQYNSTLINRVENADKKYNVDRRVYEDRWKEPGDRTFFKGIKETTATQATSRFVQDEATFTCQNLNITYDLKGNKWLRHNLGIQTLTLKGDIADLFRISTIKQERGPSYPFSRQFSFTLSVMF